MRVVAGGYGTPARYEPVTDGDILRGFRLIPSTLEPPVLRSLTLAYDYTPAPASAERVLTRNDFRVRDWTPADAPFVPTTDSRPTFYVAFDGDFANTPTMLFLDVAGATYAADADRSRATPGAGGRGVGVPQRVRLADARNPRRDTRLRRGAAC